MLRSELLASYKAVAEKYGLLSTEFPYEFNERPADEGTYVEEDGPNGMFLVHIERGKEEDRELFLSVDELLYEIFMTHALLDAAWFEFENRVEHADPRRITHVKALENIARVSADWHDRLERELQQRLVDFPYTDL